MNRISALDAYRVPEFVPQTSHAEAPVGWNRSPFPWPRRFARRTLSKPWRLTGISGLKVATDCGHYIADLVVFELPTPHV
jgi:hypothetical protein